MLLAIELGGTKLQLALGARDGAMLGKVSVPIDAEAGAEVLREQLWNEAAGLLRDHGGARIDAVAAGFGGPLDAARGVILRSHHVRGWDGFPLADWLRERFGARYAVVQNDSSTAALGEARFGAGVGLSPLVYVNSGSGIGGGLVIDGRIYQGGPLGAMEIGHLRLSRPIPLAIGEATTLEEVASGWSMVRHARDFLVLQPQAFLKHSPSFPLSELGTKAGRWTTEVVAEAALRGDPIAEHVLDLATGAMAEAIAHAITLLGPRRVILGGGVSQMADRLWLEPIRTRVAARVFDAFRDTYDIQKAQLGQDVVLYGALALAADALADG